MRDIDREGSLETDSIDEEVPRAGILTRESLFQRMLNAWEKFVRKQLVRMAEESCFECKFEISWTSRKNLVENTTIQTIFSKTIFDIAKEGSLEVCQRLYADDDDDYTFIRVQKTEDLVFVNKKTLVLFVCWV